MVGGWLVAPKANPDRKTYDIFARNILSALIIFGGIALWNYLLSYPKVSIERFISMILVVALAVGGGFSVGELLWRVRRPKENPK
jgi:hypothetical protein